MTSQDPVRRWPKTIGLDDRGIFAKALSQLEGFRLRPYSQLQSGGLDDMGLERSSRLVPFVDRVSMTANCFGELEVDSDGGGRAVEGTA